MAARHNMPSKTLSKEALHMLNSCQWPGNIKQLQGVIEQAFFHTAGSVIEASHIKLPGEHRIEKSWKHDKDAFVAAWKQAGGNQQAGSHAGCKPGNAVPVFEEI